jgi:ZIP family zinc transporter
MEKERSDIMKVIIGLLIPFLGTLLGSSMVFLMKDKMNIKVEKILLGFASGVMIAASIFSLLIPSIDMATAQNKIGWVPASVGFLLGIAFLLILDTIIPHLHLESHQPEGIHSKLKKTTMMVLAVTLHNIPEGMAVGVSFAGVLVGNTGMSIAGAFALAIGIAIQNFPEGAIISMPLRSEGLSKYKAFLYGALSGLVEPIGEVITILLTSKIVPMLPYLLSFASGAMLYVVVEELIPESQSGEHSNISTIGFALGFVIMMILDVALG